MRILVTESGEKIVSELEEFQEARKNKTEPFKMYNKKFTVERGKKRYLGTPMSSGGNTLRTPTSQRKEIFNRTSSYFIPSVKNSPAKGKRMSIKGPRRISIKATKIVFPKTIADNYENDGKQTEEIIEDIANIPELVELQKNHKPGEKYSLGEIMGESRVKELKKEFIKEEKMKNKLSRIDETQFRTTYENFSNLEKLDQVLKYKKIEPTNTNLNLIRFINQKKDLDITSLNKIVRFDPVQMMKANKVCQSVFVRQEKDRIFREGVSIKLRTQNQQEKILFAKKLNTMKVEIDCSANIFKKYDYRVDRMEKYRERYRDMDKYYWRRYNCDNLLRRTNRPQNISNSQND